MILGRAYLGNDIYLGIAPIQPLLQGYDHMEFYGSNVGLIVDKVWGREHVMGESTVDFYDRSVGTWTLDTYFLALFNNSLSAGNIVGFEEKITDWLLYRENADSNVLTFVSSTPFGLKKFIDYTVILNRTYRYYLVASNANQVSSGLVTNYEASSYYGYYLINATDDIVYLFNAEISGGEISQNTNYSKFDSNRKFNNYNVGATQYINSSITGIVRRSDNVDYMKAEDVTLLDELRTFIFDSTKKKYLKTRKGEIFEVFTYDYRATPLEQAIESQPMLVSFSYDEIGDVNA